jgi:hypothetical protein
MVDANGVTQVPALVAKPDMGLSCYRFPKAAREPVLSISLKCCVIYQEVLKVVFPKELFLPTH